MGVKGLNHRHDSALLDITLYILRLSNVQGFLGVGNDGLMRDCHHFVGKHHLKDVD